MNFNFEQPIDVLHLYTMARPSTVAPRNLTLTEELEKLEQSITLTLQGRFCAHQNSGANANEVVEIDHNFSRAHRIVTTSILPIVEQYAKHSEAVWEGSKVSSIRMTDEWSPLLTFYLVLEAILRGKCQCITFRLRRSYFRRLDSTSRRDGNNWRIATLQQSNERRRRDDHFSRQA